MLEERHGGPYNQSELPVVNSLGHPVRIQLATIMRRGAFALYYKGLPDGWIEYSPTEINDYPIVDAP